MATQIGVTHDFSSKDELASPDLRTCPQCKTVAVPRGLNSTRKLNSNPPTTGRVNGALAIHCPYCGHVYGRNTLLNRKVRNIVVSGAGGASTITVDNATLQMSVAILPDYADNQSVTWSVVAGTAVGTTINATTGLLTPGTGAPANGTVTVKATANDGSGAIGTTVITLSNQA
jgi:hypothetical protein